MKTLRFAVLALVLAVPSAWADIESPVPSSVPGISIPNTHEVGRGRGLVLRGGAPNTDARAAELKAYGVTDVLIFKHRAFRDRDEVAEEVGRLKAAGFDETQISSVPFRWKYMGPFRTDCEQTVEALRRLKAAYDTPGKVLFFHCTVGEDRTGYLAGLFRMLMEGWSLWDSFDRELCRQAYGSGNPRKPARVVQHIRDGLTPTYLKMAYLIETGLLRAEDLDPAACVSEPVVNDVALVELFRCPPADVPAGAADGR